MNNFEVHRKFKPLLKLIQGDPEYSHIDTVIVTGGRGSFKSYTVAGLLAIAMVVYEWKILYSRYVMASAADSVIAEVSEKIDLFYYRKKVKQTNTRIVKTAEKIADETDYDNKNTPQIVFKGIKTSSGNQTANLKSLKGFNCFVLDEAEEHPSHDDFIKIKRSLRRRDVQNIAILVLNPTTKTHWIYKEFYEKKGLKDGTNEVKDNIMYIHMVYTDLIRFVSDNNLRDFERTKDEDPDDYKYNILGAFREKAEGVIFTNWNSGKFINYMDKVRVFGMDFGTDDPDTLVQVSIDKRSKILYVKEFIYKRGQSVSDLIKHLKNLKITDKDIIIADSAGIKIIKDLKQAGFYVRSAEKGSGSVVAGIKKIMNYKMIVEGENIVTELNNYVWADRTTEAPIDKYNHAIDAIRYALEFAEKI